MSWWNTLQKLLARRGYVMWSGGGGTFHGQSSIGTIYEIRKLR